jgi:hypothetical protein
VKVEDIALKIGGVNLVLLHEALRTAAERAKFVVEEGTQQPTEPDQVRIRLSPVSIGEYMYQHEILAKIRSQANEISLVVSSQAFRDEGGVRTYFVAPQAIPEQVFNIVSGKLRGR